MPFENYMRIWAVAFLVVWAHSPLYFTKPSVSDCLPYYVRTVDLHDPTKQIGGVLVFENNKWVPYNTNQILSNNLADRLCK